MGWPVVKLSRTGSSVGLCAQISEWQFMHTCVDGMPANDGVLDGRVAVAAVDAVVHDVVLVTERHRLVDGLADSVTYGERTYNSSTANSSPRPSSVPPRVNRAKLFAPGLKTCATKPSCPGQTNSRTLSDMAVRAIFSRFGSPRPATRRT